MKLKRFNDENILNESQWNEEELEDLIYWLKDVSKLEYDIRNCNRGSLYLHLNKTDELIQYLENLKEKLNGIIDSI